MFQTIQRDSVISFPMLGNLSINPPSYITVFGRPIYFYGMLIGLGFLIAILYCSKRSEKFGIKQDDFYDVVIWLIPLSILGARLYFIIFNDFSYYLSNPSKLLAVWEGGLAIYGGIIAGLLVIFCICRKKGIRVTAFLDLIVFGLLMGQILGRWGNFMNREAFGAITDVFCRMGLTAPDGTTIYVHPTFLYESLWNLGILIFLLICDKKGLRKYDGQYILTYFMLYGIGRAWIEGLRTDSLYIGGTGIRVSQALSIVLALVCGAALFINSRKEHKSDDLFVNTVKAQEEAADETDTTL